MKGNVRKLTLLTVVVIVTLAQPVAGYATVEHNPPLARLYDELNEMSYSDPMGYVEPRLDTVGYQAGHYTSATIMDALVGMESNAVFAAQAHGYYHDHNLNGWLDPGEGGAGIVFFAPDGTRTDLRTGYGSDVSNYRYWLANRSRADFDGVALAVLGGCGMMDVHALGPCPCALTSLGKQLYADKGVDYVVGFKEAVWPDGLSWWLKRYFVLLQADYSFHDAAWGATEWVRGIPNVESRGLDSLSDCGNGSAGIRPVRYGGH